jgi:hypothetical protein
MARKNKLLQKKAVSTDPHEIAYIDALLEAIDEVIKKYGLTSTIRRRIKIVDENAGK